MSKLEQVLIMEPAHDLHFGGPFTDVCTSKLKLSNPSQTRVCFKVKTTAPKMYCVRPNSGLIQPGQFLTISVMLQPVPNYDNTEKCRHKFMVQTMFAPDDEFESQEELWKAVEPDMIMASRLRCVFDMPGQNNLSPVEEIQEGDKKSTNVKVVESTLNLKDENIKLKEQVTELILHRDELKMQTVRMRKIAMEDTVTSTPPTTNMSSTNNPPPSTLPSFLYLFAALILGFIIAKLIF